MPLSDFLEASPYAMLVVDRQGAIVLLNALAERLFGYPRGELLEQPLEILIPERLRARHADLRGAFQAMPRARAMGSGLELIARRKDGTEFPVEVGLGSVQDQPEPLVFAVVSDITERQRARQVIENSLRTQGTVAAIMRLCLDSASLEETLERALDVLLAAPGFAFRLMGAIFLKAEDNPELVLQAHRGLPVSLQPEGGRLRSHQCLCGNPVPARHAEFFPPAPAQDASPLSSLCPYGHYCVPIVSDDELLGLINLAVDVGHEHCPEVEQFLTAVADALAGTIRRRRTEAALHASQERFDLAVRGSAAGIWDWDLRTNHLYFSRRCELILGYEDQELPHEFQVWESHLHPAEREHALATVRDYLEGRTAEYELEHRLRHKDGSYRWILARGAAVFDEHGQPYRMLGSLLDITERKRAESDLEHQRAQLLAAQCIQRCLLPNAAPQIPGFEIGGAMYPADFAAGDHFDYVAMPGGTLGIIVGDVSGHGFAAAVFMATVHARLRALTEETQLDVDQILTRTNAALLKEAEPTRFVTVFFGCLDPTTRTLRYASAGHPAGYVLDRTGDLRAELRSTSLPLAIAPDADFSLAAPVQLQAGDVVVLLTDGAHETFSPTGEFLGIERVLDVVRRHLHESPQEILAQVHNAACEFAHPAPLADDLTGVIIKVR